MAAPNIVNVATITGKTVPLALTTTQQTLVSNAASSGQVYKVNSLVIANVNGAASASVTVSFFRATTEYKLAHTIFVPAQASLVIISKDAGIYLEENDSIRIVASLNSYLHAVCSYEVIS